MHPKNRHQGRYDFDRLIQSDPTLKPYVRPNRFGERSVDFADPEAVKALNRALLKDYYGIVAWDIPHGYLCPPIPGRADYVHQMADLLAEAIPAQKRVRVLDIGVGANCIYPIIGLREYGWEFVGTDIDPKAVEAARRIVDANRLLQGSIEIRLQADPEKIFSGVVHAGEHFDLSLCNPPFHASLEEAQAGSARKWRNLGHGDTVKKNFGGKGGELWYPGGEVAFIGKMIEESAAFAKQITWFSSLVSKESSIPGIERALKKVGARDFRIADMAQGQKKSRLVTWMF